MVAIFILVSAVAAVLISWLVIKGTNDGLSHLKGAFNTTNVTVIHSAMSGISKKPKLVVVTPELTVEIVKTKETRGFGIYWGTTTTMVRAHGNQCQYYVPVGAITDKNYTFDPDHKILTLRPPLPVLDEEMVDVQSDPKQIEVRTEAGWSSLKGWEGKKVEDEAKAELRPAVIEAGKAEQYQSMAREQGRKVVAALLEQTLRAVLRPDVKVEVEWDSPGNMAK